MISVALRDSSQVAEARRRALMLAESVSLDEQGCGRLALVVTEAATNVLRHGGGGEMILAAAREPEGGRVDVLALDRGPGMANVQECLRDGVSSTDTPGNGLGAIQRLSDHLDIWSRPGQGTVVSCGIAVSRRPPGRLGAGIDMAALCLPKAGERVGGDAWALRPLDGGFLMLLCDGLGHGPGAHEAAAAACAAFATAAQGQPAAVLNLLHQRLGGTRGAAAAVVRIDLRSRRMVFAGLGNLSGWLRGDGGTQRPLSQNGILGHGTPRLREESYGWKGSLLAVFHSDGLGTKWDLETYPGLISRPPATIAGVLYRDFRRSRDDVLIVVMRAEEP